MITITTYFVVEIYSTLNSDRLNGLTYSMRHLCSLKNFGVILEISLQHDETIILIGSHDNSVVEAF